jgi:hypothetical protein
MIRIGLYILAGLAVLMVLAVAIMICLRWRFVRALRQARQMIESEFARMAAPQPNPESPRAPARPMEDFFRAMREQQVQVELYTAAFRAVREQAGLDEREWKRIEDRVLLITDAAGARQIAGAVLESLPPRERDGLDADALAEQFSGGPIRERFAQWNLAQPPERRFDRIAQIETPLPADAWLAPGA